MNFLWWLLGLEKEEQVVDLPPKKACLNYKSLAHACAIHTNFISVDKNCKYDYIDVNKDERVRLSGEIVIGSDFTGKLLTRSICQWGSIFIHIKGINTHYYTVHKDLDHTKSYNGFSDIKIISRREIPDEYITEINTWSSKVVEDFYKRREQYLALQEQIKQAKFEKERKILWEETN